MDEWFNLNASIRRAVDPLALMQRVADQAFDALEGADEVLVGLLVDEGSLGYVCTAGITTERVGQAISLEQSLLGQALREGRTLVAGDTETDPRADREASPERGIRSMVSVPLMRPDGALGILSAGSRRAHAFEPREVVLLAGLAEFITAVVGAARDFSRVTARLAGETHADADAEGGGTDESPGGGTDLSESAQPSAEERRPAGKGGLFAAGATDPDGERQAASRAWVEQIVAARDFSLVFQPIFDLENGSMLAAEALVRFSAWGSKTPAAVIAFAHRVGLGVELEVAIVEAALAHLGELPQPALLSVNAGPAALASGGITAALANVHAERVIVELTEHMRVDDHPRIARMQQDLRATGARLAIDDAGAGFAGLMHILRVAPTFIKLDGELISSIEVDPVRRSLASSLIRFAGETGAVTIAEQIETAAELAALRELGVRYGQGFHLARPLAASDLPPALAPGVSGLAA